MVAEAANGATATSDKGKFSYILLPEVSPIGPGVDLGVIESNPTQQGALADDSYDKPITLSWLPVQNAASYGVKLGRWPWRFPLASQEPANCLPLLPDGSGFCISGPKPTEVTIPATTVVQGESLLLTKEVAGRGRYCWEVWPRVAGDVQPFVEAPNVFCYTTGPSIPDLKYDPGFEPPAGFTGAPIKGTVIFDYHPNTRPVVNIKDSNGNVAHSWEWSPECTVVTTNVASEWTPEKRWMFGDLYNCKYHFDLTPQQNKTYTISATTFGKNGVPKTKEFPAISTECGTENKGCCNGVCSSSTLSCQSGVCKKCGGVGETCCPSSSSNPQGCRDNGKCTGSPPKCAACQRDTSLACTDSDQCCPGDKCATFLRDNVGGLSAAPRCTDVPCGINGYPCCLENGQPVCNGGLCLRVKPGTAGVEVNMCLTQSCGVNDGDPCCPFFPSVDGGTPIGIMCLDGKVCGPDIKCHSTLPNDDDAGLPIGADAVP